MPEKPTVRPETSAVLAGVALDLGKSMRLPSGEVIISAADAVDVAIDLIKAAVHCDPEQMARIKVANEPIDAIMLDGPLQGYKIQVSTFFGLAPGIMCARAEDAGIKGSFKYTNTGKLDDGGRLLYSFVERVDEEKFRVRPDPRGGGEGPAPAPSGGQ